MNFNSRSNFLDKLETPRTRTTSYGDRAFVVAGAEEWNKLPMELKGASTGGAPMLFSIAWNKPDVKSRFDEKWEKYIADEKLSFIPDKVEESVHRLVLTKLPEELKGETIRQYMGTMHITQKSPS